MTPEDIERGLRAVLDFVSCAKDSDGDWYFDAQSSLPHALMPELVEIFQKAVSDDHS